MKVTQSCPTLSLWPHGLYNPWNSPSQNTGVGSLSLLQGIFPTQGSNPGLPQCRQILYQLSHKGSPRILEWVADPFSSGSSWPRNWTRVSCIAGRFFTSWAIREARVPEAPLLPSHLYPLSGSKGGMKGFRVTQCLRVARWLSISWLVALFHLHSPCCHGVKHIQDSGSRA